MSARPRPPQAVRLAELTYEEAQQRLATGAVGLLPVGATEAHGPHLPLGTDVVIALAAAERAALRVRGAGHEALVLPPLAYAVTEFAAGFAGTLSVPAATARALVRDVLLAAHRTGLRGVVLCNAHLEPAHLQVLRDAVTEAAAQGARAEFPDVTRRPHALRLGDEFRSGACHAGRYETSLVLAAEPFLVRESLARSLPDNPVSLSRAIREGKASFEQAGGPRAYFGAPAAASAAEGDALLETLADIFATAALELLDRATSVSAAGDRGTHEV
ncbi:MAG: creatininase family protein [Myxococcota bacterium]|nr:creatininase family protein [Myxococcota bacterium]MDW8364145.1 creatininase family protein [Myxococcales bacterium]